MTPRADTPSPLIVHQFVQRAARTPEAMAFAVYAPGAARATRTFTWGEWHTASRALAAHLVLADVAAGDRVAILSANTPLWPIADMAVQMIGAIGVGINPASTPAQVSTLLNDCGATLTLAADEETWSAWVAHGIDALASDASLQAKLDQRLSAIAPDDLAAIIYTSGSTGEAKGACISHRYLAASAASIITVLEFTADDRALSFLPYAHAAERVFGLCSRIASGMPAALIEDPADLFRVAVDFEPTVFGALPRIFERLYEAVEVARHRGDDPRAALASRIGRRCRVATSGGASMPSAIARELADLGVTILGAYGQTEHLCIAMNRPSHVRFDTVGLPMPGTTVRISEDGELQVARGPLTFSGYWNNAAATRAAFTEDGQWLHTGDLAELDTDGTLRITGRRKEIIALSTGRKVAPLPIETALTASPYIAHALCHGEGRKYVTALLSPRRAVVEAFARAQALPTPWPALLDEPVIRALFQAAVDAVNADLARPDHVQRFALTDHEFTHAGGELTPTLKLVRHVVNARFASTFDALYGEAA